MSDLKNIHDGIRVEPLLAGEPAAAPPPDAATQPGIGLLLISVLWPSSVIAVELAWRLCTEVFFDPMPSFWHVLAVAFVPAANLVAWVMLRRPGGLADMSPRAARWLVLGNGAPSPSAPSTH